MKRLLVPIMGLLVLALAGPVQAAPLVREHYSGSDSYDFDDCGFAVHVDVTFEGVFMLKAPRADGAPPYLFDNYEVHETLTANGKTLTVDHQGLYKDLRITHVEGTVYQFVAIEAGRPFVVRDEDGTVLLRDRGLLKSTFQVDTMGDTDLSNDVFIEASFEVLKDAGAHPGFYLDMCAALEEYFFG